MRIAVAGATGVIGQQVVRSAAAAGHSVVGLSRASGVDLLGADGLAARLDGVDAVVDVTNVSTLRRAPSVAFFETVTRNLLAAEQAAGVGHHLALSIVGVDRVPSGYYQGKLRQEEVVAAGDVPWTVLRATQFHEFPGQLAARVRGPVVPVPRMRSATVATSEVADQLVSLAAGPATGHAPDMSGPEVHDMPSLVRRLFAARGVRRRVVALRVPGRAGRLMREGGLLPVTPGVVGRMTFSQWLES